MILKMFAIFDNKADVYMTPFFFPATGQAVRAFADLVGDERSTVSKHPDDYKLVLIGEWDDSTGVCKPLSQSISLGFGSDFVVKPSSLKAV